MYKRIIAALVSIILVCSATVFAAEDNGTPTNANNGPSQFSAPIADNNAKATPIFTIESADKLVTENDNLAIYLNESKFIMKIKDKSTGYIWSTSARADKMEGMSTEWQRFCQSMLVMDFITTNGTIKRSALKHPTAKKTIVKYTDNGFTATVNFFEAKATLDMIVSLNENGVNVSIPDESITLKDGNIVNRILVMPFLGAGYKDETPGYLFVPDGSGALMNFEQPQIYGSIYQQKIYGDDIAVSKLAPATSVSNISKINKIFVPVFGSVHGISQNAFAGIVTSGDEYCEINASPAGTIVDYSWISPGFIYNEIYWQPTGGAMGFNAIQQSPNVVNAQVEYRFINNQQANYTGIANEYKSLLLKSNTSLTKNEPQTNVPIKIDALMAEPSKSLFGNSTQVMSTGRDVERWINEFNADGINNLVMTLTGFEKDGSSGHKIGKFTVDKAVSSKKQLQDLDKKISSLGGRLFLQTDLQTGYEHQVAKAALKFGMDGSPINVSETKPLFTNRVYSNDKSVASNAAGFAKDSSVKNFSLQTIASELQGDYKRNQLVSRAESAENIKKTIQTMSDNSTGLILQSPNAYALKAGKISGAYDIPVNNSQFSFFSSSVPFLQIVFSGYIDCYSEYQNFTTNTAQDVLKLIDYNTYPSYILTNEYSNKLVKTNMNNIYSSRYDDWMPYIVKNYTMLNETLSKVSGAAIIGRRVVADGVSVTDYDNGISVIVNYNSNSVKVNGMSVDEMSAIALKTTEVLK